MKKRIIALLALLSLVLALAGCGAEPDLRSKVTGTDELAVHVIDVGQADAILIKTPQQGNILIDGGTGESEKALVSYIEKQGVDRLDVVIATHPHEDHIGGLDAVIDAFDVGVVYMPKISHTTKAFERMVQSIQRKEIPVEEAKADVRLPLGDEGVQAMFLAPCAAKYDELNDYSAVLKLVYGETSFLFTGDAEKLSEEEMLSRYSAKTLAATVLKVGHHGSKTSTSEAFLKAVSPQMAAISVGAGNDYGLPSDSTLALLKKQGVPYWRTDEVGSIVFTSDGHSVKQGRQEARGSDEAALLTEESTGQGQEQTAAAPPSSATVGVGLLSVDRAAEVVIISNTGEQTVDLSGWVLVSVQGDQRFTFPAGTTLPAGAELRVVSGEDAQAADGQLVWSKQNIWNNKHDPAELYDAAGSLIDEMK